MHLGAGLPRDAHEWVLGTALGERRGDVDAMARGAVTGRERADDALQPAKPGRCGDVEDRERRFGIRMPARAPRPTPGFGRLP